jgi:hypothetical protein
MILALIPRPEVLALPKRFIIALPMLANCPNRHRVLRLMQIGKKKFSDANGQHRTPVSSVSEIMVRDCGKGEKPATSTASPVANQVSKGEG